MDRSRKDLSDKSLIMARRYKTEQKYARSFAHYLVHWQISSLISGQSCPLEEIIQVFDGLTLNLEAENRTRDLISTYQQAMEVLPSQEIVSFRYASALFRVGDYLKALKVLETCASTKSKELSDTIKTYCVDRWHFSMLNDERRNETYQKWLASSVKSIDFVLDIGTGCGLLSILALKSRPKKILACEASKEMFEIAEIVLKSNRLDKCIMLKHCLSTHLDFSQDARADVLVTETFDAGLFGEHVLEILDHAWTKLLHTGSKVIPGKARIYIALVKSEEFKTKHKLVRDSCGLLDLSGLDLKSEESLKEPYDSEKLSEDQIVSTEKLLVEVDFNDKECVSRLLKDGEKITKVFESFDQTFDAIALWFELFLDENCQSPHISTRPDSKSCWEQALFHVDHFKTNENDIEIEFLIKGHVQIPSGNQNACLKVPSKMIQTLNQAQEISLSAETILDLAEVPLRSLDILKNDPKAKLTMVMMNDESDKSKVDLVTEIANNNAINLENIDGISLESLNNTDRYDLLIFDPVSQCGRLKSHILGKLKTFGLNNFKMFSPQKLTLKIALIESHDLLLQNRVSQSVDKISECKISNEMNKFSVNHVQNVNLKHVKIKYLSQSINILLNDFSGEQISSVRDEFEIQMIESGMIHGILYWFEFTHPNNQKESTLENAFYNLSAIILDTPQEVNHEVDDFLSIEVIFEDYYIDLKLS